MVYVALSIEEFPDIPEKNPFLAQQVQYFLRKRAYHTLHTVPAGEGNEAILDNEHRALSIYGKIPQ